MTSNRDNNLDHLFDDDEDEVDPFDDYDIDLNELEANNARNAEDEQRQDDDDSRGEQERRKDDAGVDEEIKIRRRRPVVKLDDQRLLSEAGLPKLQRTAPKKIKFKGKGHELHDMRQIVTFYQLWMHDLFPKARFEDSMAIIEKLGHTKRVQAERIRIIEEYQKAKRAEEIQEKGQGLETSDAAQRRAETLKDQDGGNVEKSGAYLDDEEDDDYLYTNDAIPKQQRTTSLSTGTNNNNSLFIMDDDDEDDDEDAIPTSSRRKKISDATNSTNLLPKSTRLIIEDDDKDEDEDDLDALIRDAEQAQSTTKKSPSKNSPLTITNKRPASDNDMDDLDQLIAESEKAEAERAEAAKNALLAKTSETAKMASPMKKRIEPPPSLTRLKESTDEFDDEMRAMEEYGFVDDDY